jgi:hypothetical protein
MGEYKDIFDGNICHSRLRALDGSLFFLNLPHKKNRPYGKLRIGINLGLNWYICQAFLLYIINMPLGSLTVHLQQHRTFSLIMSNIFFHLQPPTQVPVSLITLFFTLYVYSLGTRC